MHDVSRAPGASWVQAMEGIRVCRVWGALHVQCAGCISVCRVLGAIPPTTQW